MKKAKAKSWTLTGKGIWICPRCKKEVEVTICIDPYRTLAENPQDEMCPHCKDFFSLSFYDDGY